MKYQRLKNPGTRVILRLIEKHEGKKGLKVVQRALNEMGKDLLIDGIIGPVTIAAIKSVNNKILHKKIETLLYRGVDSKTNLKEDERIRKDGNNPIWIDIAEKEIGVKEIPGRGSNPRIEQYHSAAGGGGWSDDVPWCASFVSFVMQKAGYKLPKYPARALSWLKFGKSAYRPVYGAIAVKKRKGGGHVTFVVGKSKDGKYLYCLGGNQSDEVNIRRYRASIFKDFRIPIDYDKNKAPKLAVLKNIYDNGWKEA